MRSPFPWPARLVALPLVVALAASGCGDDDDDASDGATDAVSATTAPADADAGGDGGEDDAVTEVVAVDFGFDGLPDTIEAGTRLTLRNDSDVEVHELVAMAIPQGETRSAEELLALPEPELFAALPGEPALVLVAPPGEESVPVVGDGTLEAGRYLVLCAIPTGADPDELMQAMQEASGGPPQVDGGPPHFTSGMYAELTVE
jgi:hypothetical protein